MISKVLTVRNSNGIHLRVAAKLVDTSRRHKSNITFFKDGKKASAASILELLFLEATQQSTVTVIVEGEDEAAALKQTELVLTDGAGI